MAATHAGHAVRRAKGVRFNSQEVGVNVTNAVTYAAVPREALAGAARRMLTVSEVVMMTVVPAGGQRIARRNALASVRADVVAARERAEALAAIVPAPAPLLTQEHAAS
jgi:hypothetical protein